MSINPNQVEKLRALAKTEKTASVALIKAQRNLFKALYDRTVEESKANEATLKAVSNKKRVREAEAPSVAPLKKQKSPEKKEEEEDWKCSGNVLLGDANPGCPGGTEKHLVRAADTKIKGKGRFPTCRACKNAMRKTKKNEK